MSFHDDKSRPGVTSRLSADQRITVILPALGSLHSSHAIAGLVYIPVPYNYKSIPNPAPWKVMLRFGTSNSRTTAALEIYGDIVLGRGADSTDSPDIDVSNLDALNLGVSRRHAMLRPTPNKLYLIDLGSTNGTFVNAIPVSRGMAQVLRNYDAVSLAGLSFVVEIVQSPAEAEEGATLGETEPHGAASPSLKLGEKPKIGRETAIAGPLTLPPGLGDPPTQPGNLPTTPSGKPEGASPAGLVDEPPTKRINPPLVPSEKPEDASPAGHSKPEHS